MLLVDDDELDRMESRYPGIKESILRYEAMTLPRCPYCSSSDTAHTAVGTIGRTMNMSAATTKFKLCGSRPTWGEFYCNNCREFYEQVEEASDHQ